MLIKTPMDKQNIGSTIFYSFIQVISAIFFLYISLFLFWEWVRAFLITIYIVYLWLKRIYKKSSLYIWIWCILTYVLWIIIWTGFTELYEWYLYDSYNPWYLWNIIITILLGMVITYFLAWTRFLVYYFIYLFIFIFLYLF